MEELELIRDFLMGWSDGSEAALVAGKGLNEVVEEVIYERHQAYCREYDLRWGLQQELERHIGVGRTFDVLIRLEYERKERARKWQESQQASSKEQ
jgi:hypothetical protein